MDAAFKVLALCVPADKNLNLAQVVVARTNKLPEARTVMSKLASDPDCVAAVIYSEQEDRNIAHGNRSHVKYRGAMGWNHMTLNDWDADVQDSELRARMLPDRQVWLMGYEIFHPQNEGMYRVVWREKDGNGSVRRKVMDEEGLNQLGRDTFVEIISNELVFYTEQDHRWIKLIAEFKIRQLAKVDSEEFPPARTLIHVREARGENTPYEISVMGVNGGIYRDKRLPLQSAVEFTVNAVEAYGLTNPMGATLKAPKGFQALIPEHLHNILPEHADVPPNKTFAII